MAKVALMSFREFISLARQTVHNTRCERVLGAVRDRITVVRPGPQQPPMDERLVALFDWVADQLELATPYNIVAYLSDEDGEQNACVYDHTIAVRMFYDMVPRDRNALVRRWFDEIEPGQVEMEEW